MHVGFIGLGLMGEPMSLNILKKYDKGELVFDLNSAALQNIVSQGAVGASSIKEIGEKCDVIISMVPKSEHVISVYNELYSTIKPGKYYIEMSTISPAVSKEIAEKVKKLGGRMIDAPVVKSRPAAFSGDLGIYVGGDQADFDKLKPILDCIGSNVIRMGSNGSGLVMKLAHNSLVSEIQNGVNELIKFAQVAGGIDPLTFAKAISYGGGQNFYLDGKVNAIANRDFTTAFSVANMNKDLHLSKELADKYNLKLEGLNLTTKNYEKLMERNLGNLDFSASYLLMEDNK